MKKEIRIVDEQRGILQITTHDERHYAKQVTDEGTGLPKIAFEPSVTWVCSFYPKGVAFFKWLADKGWDEAEAIKAAAGDKGSKVHLACASLLEGQEVNITAPGIEGTRYLNKSTGQLEELTAEEYECVMAFADWYKNGACPRCKKAGCFDVIAFEYVVWGDGYAGSVDLKVRLRCCGAVGIVDIKSGQNIWREYELQVSAYKHADPETIDFLGILQVGYRRNKNQKWKFTEVPDRFDLFLAARQIWAVETEGVKPLQKDYPLSISLPDRMQSEVTEEINELVAAE